MKKGNEAMRQHQREQERAAEEAAAQRAQRARGTVGVYDFGLPRAPDSLPRGVRVIDCRGSFAVALACCGQYLGLFRRGQ